MSYVFPPGFRFPCGKDYFKNDPQSAETEGASKGEESKKSKYHRRWSDDSLDDNSTTSEGFYMYVA